MKQSSTTHMPYCTDHAAGGLCRSKEWTIAGVRLALFGCETDLPATQVTFHAGTYRAAYTAEEASRLSESLSALAILAAGTDEATVAYWSARLDVLQGQDDRLATS